MINLRNPQIDLINRSVNAAQYVWNFGDGTTSTLANPQHLYDRTGRFTITLIATHANGCTDTTFQVLTIGELTDFLLQIYLLRTEMDKRSIQTPWIGIQHGKLRNEYI